MRPYQQEDHCLEGTLRPENNLDNIISDHRNLFPQSKSTMDGGDPTGTCIIVREDVNTLESTGKKRRRYSLQHNNILGFSNTEWQEMKPKLSSLVLPWALVAFIAIGCTIATAYFSDSDSPPLPDEELSPDLTTLERILDESTSEHYDPLIVDDYDIHHRNLGQHHHPALFPLTTSDYIGFSLCTLGLMVAAGGGIGGGGILVPIYSLVFGFSAKHAIPLSNVSVLGGAVANTLLNAPKRHPLADRPLVDWDLILVMEPLTVAGALIGAFLNKLLPVGILTVMLVILLSFTAYTSLKQAVKMYKVETIRMREQGIRADGSKESELTKLAHEQDDHEEVDASEPLLDHAVLQESDDPDSKDSKDGTSAPNTDKESPDDEEIENVELLETDASKKEQLQKILEEDRTVQMSNIYILIAMFVVVLAINILKGGGAFPSPIGIRCGSSSFWIANGIILGWIIIITIFVRAYLLNRHRIKQRVGYKYVEGDIKWDGRATIVYPLVCTLAGFFAGMFGVGGGIVKGPLMLAMGIHPAVSSATSACMILFTSFTATTSFVVFGLLVNDYAVVCFILGFAATYVGQVGLTFLMKKSNRNSYIAFSIGGVVLLSAFLMTIQSLLHAAEGEHEKSGGLCGKES